MSRGPLAPLLAPLRTVLLFSLVINLALLAPSIFMLQVFDRVLSTRSVETLAMLAVIAGGTLVLMGVLENYRSRTLAGLGVRLEQLHGEPLLRQLLLGTARGDGGGWRDGMRDLGRVRAFLSGSGVVALFDAPWTVIFLVLIWLFHPALGLLATVCAAALAALAVLNEWLSRGTIEALDTATRRAGQQADAGLRQAEAVVALGMPGAVARRWAALGAEGHALAVRLSGVAGAITAISRVARQAVQVLMLGFGAWLVIHEHATPGVMLASTIILGRALAPVEMLIANWRAIVEARGAWSRLQAQLGKPPLGRVGTELPRPKGRLAVEGLTVMAPGGQRPLLQGVGFSAEPGQVLAVLGPSGSGKSTLARALVGLAAPASGSVRLDGAELHTYDAERLGGWIGYVPQDVAMFDGSVAQNIARLSPVDSAAVLRAAQQAHAHELLLRLPAGYDTPLGDGGVRLSGGQRQRVALARALYGDPPLVVMDEPDASLDAEGEQALLAALRDLKARGATVVLVTQRRAVLAVADRAMVLRDGAVERIGDVEPATPMRVAVAGAGGGA